MCLVQQVLLQANERYWLVDRIKTDTLANTPKNEGINKRAIKHRGNMLYIIDFPNPVGRVKNTSLPSKG